MADAVEPHGLAIYKAVTLRNASRGVAAVMFAGIALLAAWFLDVPLFRRVLPASISIRADLALVAGLTILVALCLVLWWNTRSLVLAEARILHRDRLNSMLSHCNQAIVHS